MGLASLYGAAILLALGLMADPAAAAPGLNGVWNDNASQGLQIGRLHVGATRVRIGRKASYAVKTVQEVGSAVILKVIGPASRRDFFGCSANHQVTYLVLQPLPSQPTIPGFDMQAMSLIFYGGDQAPDLRTLDTDRSVCAIHPYGRTPPSALPIGRKPPR